MPSFSLHNADCLNFLGTMDDCSIDSIVTDPPYGISFMGKKWDYDVPSVNIWKECLRVLKPGGHLLAFAGTRTQHRMAIAIEDAGFEIRDMIAWVYGSGFPKSLDVSKAIDKAAGAKRDVVGANPNNRNRTTHEYNSVGNVGSNATITAPATPEAQQWAGWGTALKPALEPITMARKPLTGTVAANVLEHGTGALNVDKCRVAGEPSPSAERRKHAAPGVSVGATGWTTPARPDSYNEQRAGESLGRWPANLIHDGSDEVAGLFPDAKGQQGAITGSEASSKTNNTFGDYANRTKSTPRNDSGSAARFFYCAKTSKRERGEGNNHPTVKPITLMAYLCRLVTPPGGTVLDPFMGSGSTGIAALQEGFDFIGIEREAEYVGIAESRIEASLRQGGLS
jgi:site-specific DNA-methyltransferase (adenine-specific)